MVLISHTHKFIFFKTKKTASTSVEMFFEPFCLPESAPPRPEYCDEFIGPTGIVGSRRGKAKRRLASWPQHMRAMSVLRKAGPRVFLSYFKFATVRNPFTRTLSAFRYTYHRDRDALAALSFAEHREAFNTWLDQNYFAAQDRRMYTIAGWPVANAYIRYEHLGEDIQAICARLGLPCDLDRLPHTKKM
ncbi:MAG: sulfotransferase family 2 domain-containing protein, partial [Pseudomonadota bacterium]